MDFIAIRVRKDNLMYLFYNNETAFSVDSFDPGIILHSLSCDFTKNVYTSDEILKIKATHKKRRLKYAFTTHKHYDHAGGNDELSRLSPNTIFLQYDNLIDGQIIEIENFICFPNKNRSYSIGEEELSSEMNIKNKQRDFQIESNCKNNITTIKCLFTPCHTKCSVCYHVKSSKNYLLTGDFLFKLGCGKFFEGTSDNFIKSLSVIRNNCKEDTIMLYGHDYYDNNRRFVEYLINQSIFEIRFLQKPISSKNEKIKQLDSKEFSIDHFLDSFNDYFLTFYEESIYNPFINYEFLSIEGTAQEKISKLREMKDNFQ